MVDKISHTELTQLLSYDCKSGKFAWRVTKNSYGGKVKVGAIAGHININGYCEIRLNGRRYLGHRLAWFYVNKEWPSSEIDHINGNPSDNSITNLRCVTRSQNSQNTKIRSDNSSGIKGVSWSKSVNKWVAYVNIDGKRKHLGCFDDIQDATEARLASEKVYHAEYARS